jgi:methionyl-tRNA formyltransferase
VGAGQSARLMRIALIGQAAFGESVYRALRDAGEDVVVVSSVRGPKERPDPLYTAAKADDIPVFSTGKLKEPDVLERYAATRPDLCVMAFVTHILPESVITSPRLGTIEYHPSLLPLHRGRSALHWAIRMGDTRTGLTVFWVDEGIDTGPILLQREVDIAPDDTVGSLYFDKLYPMGVAALTDAVRMVREGAAPRLPQDNEHATYEHPAEGENSRIDWRVPAQQVYDLVRGSNPQPGAHARLNGRVVRFWDSRLTLNTLSGAPGTVLNIGETIDVELSGGVLHAKRLSLEGGKKLPAPEFAEAAGLRAGDRFEAAQV